MAATVVISFKDIDSNERVRREVQTRCDALAEEFPETTRFEVILSADGSDHTATGHVTGNHTEAAGQAKAPELFQAADKALHALERQLRRSHDKRIFSQRREAQRASERRKSGS
jgi:ribosomal subunit interface protein